MLRRSSFFVVWSFLVWAIGIAPACSDPKLDLGDGPGDEIVKTDAASVPASPEPDAAAPETSTPEAASPLPPATTVQEAMARCADPTHGVPTAFGSASAFTGAFARRWFNCKKGTWIWPVYRDDGIEFHADGRWNLLRASADGKSFAALSGGDNEGTWDVMGPGASHVAPDDSTPSPVSAVWIRMGGSEFATGVEFETNPRRLHATHKTSGSTEAWLVPLGP